MNGKSTKRAPKPAKGPVRDKPKSLRPLTATPAPSAPAKSKSKAQPKPSPQPKDKRIDGSFSMPQSDFALIARLKETAKRNGQTFKKNELLRAGLRVLSAMPEWDLLATLAAVKPAKAHPESR